jgi:hypothetical protein
MAVLVGGKLLYEERIATTIQDVFGEAGMDLAVDQIMRVLPEQI